MLRNKDRANGKERSTETINIEILREIHRYAIDAGSKDEISLRDAVRDEAALFFISEEANTIIDDIRRAAFLLHRIATRHPFIEGNKRTALLAAEDALGASGLSIRESPKIINEVVRKIASGDMEEDEIVLWFKSITFIR